MYQPAPYRREKIASRHSQEKGVGTLEILVSLSLMLTTMSVATQMVVRYFRLTKSHEAYCLALDELSNQMDRLTVLPQPEVNEAVQQLVSSEFIRERLPGVKLSGEIQPMEGGTHLTLRISWDEIDRGHAPVQLSGWCFESAVNAKSQNQKAQSR